ncbi:MAG: transglycosylase SLT domain-containing protein [Rhodocyclales bacterium]|nr:transglycosylase SLT domain-containing protein [Rhodocyclales bacterium]
MLLLLPILVSAQAPPLAAAAPQAAATLVSVPLVDDEAAADAFRVFVKDIRILSGKLLPESVLKPQVSEFIGRSVGIGELRGAALAIGEFYRERGHAARVVLPQQTVRDGVVRIVVIESPRRSAALEPASDPRQDQNIAPLVARGQPTGDAAMRREQRRLADFIAARYRVAPDLMAPVVACAYQAGSESAIDPLLILAVIAIESGFNPAAESSRGAKGLMQVRAKFHMEKVALHGDEEILLDPQANIRVGTQILREYLRRFGATEAALQMYGGATNDPGAAYARKVLSERARIERTLAHLRREA